MVAIHRLNEALGLKNSSRWSRGRFIKVNHYGKRQGTELRIPVFKGRWTLTQVYCIHVSMVGCEKWNREEKEEFKINL